MKLTLLDRVKEFFGQKVLAYTANLYSGAGDGNVYKTSNSWSTTHDAAIGTGADYTPTVTTDVLTSDDGSDKDIYRTFLPFDTSAIPGTATIISATLNVYVTLTYDNDNDSQDYINVVQTFQADSTTLVVGDYEDCGSDNGTAARAKYTPIQTGATAIDLTAGFTASAYNTFTLNATGLGWIAKNGVASSCGTTAGVTCLGLREGHDMENSTIAGNSYNGIIFSTSEETAVPSKVPYLTVDYETVIRIDGGTIKIDGGTIKIDS